MTYDEKWPRRPLLAFLVFGLAGFSATRTAWTDEGQQASASCIVNLFCSLLWESGLNTFIRSEPLPLLSMLVTA